MLEIPEVVRNKALAAGAARWLEDLPTLVEGLAAEWGLCVERPFADATEAFVAPATREDGTPVVIKVLVPRDEDVARHEIQALRLANGEGCARLLEADVERGALLLERLGRPMVQCGLRIDERHEILCDLAVQFWRPAPALDFPSGAEKGRWLIGFITRLWNELDRPCDEQTIAHAVRCAERRIAAYDPERAVLVHGDVHQWNALEAGGGFKLVDPDGLVAEPEYDLAILMREDPEDLLAWGDPRARSHGLAQRTGLDETAIWEWGVVERVSTGLLLRRVGMEDLGRQMLDAADRVRDLSSTYPVDLLDELDAIQRAAGQGSRRTADFERARGLIAHESNDVRWQALIAIAEWIPTAPDAVWDVVAEFGESEDEDMRGGVATVLLEHLLEHHYDTILPRVRARLEQHAPQLADTLRVCFVFGLAKERRDEVERLLAGAPR
jgi:streptomycin 6-kinase